MGRQSIALAFALLIVASGFASFAAPAAASEKAASPDGAAPSAPVPPVGPLVPTTPMAAPPGGAPALAPEDAIPILRPALPAVLEGASPSRPRAEGDASADAAVLVNVESPHNYPNGFDQSWWVYGPPQATIMTLRFTTRLEANFDHFYVYDANGVTIVDTTANLDNSWSAWLSGNKARVRLTSDGSVSNWGFRVDMIQVATPVNVQSPHPYANSYDSGQITVDGTPDDDFGSSILKYARINTEANFDFVYDYNQAGTQLESLTGAFTNRWTPWSGTNQMRVRLTSDGTVTDWGYQVTDTNDLRNAYVESPHKYSNSQTLTQYVYGTPGALQTAIHFSRVGVENGYDFVRVYDANNALVATISGTYSSGLWTAWGAGAFMKIVFTSDSIVDGWGYRVDMVDSVSNSPPYTPSSPSPANGATNVGVTTFLTWTGGDPNGDTVYYDVYRDVGSTANTLICDDVTTASCPTMGPPAPLAYSTTYAWRVVARDSSGAVTNGPTWTFTTQADPNQPPYTPSSPSPANGATNVGVSTFLTWSGGDPNGGTVYYDVYRNVGTTASTLVCDDVTTASCPVTGPPAPLAYSTTYAWRVVARDPTGLITNGPTWTFTTQPDPNQPPYTPSSPSPANGATNVGVTTFLTWTGGDPNGGTVYYDVYRNVGTTASTLICDDVTTASCPTMGPPAPLAYSTTYAWRVVARDPTGLVTNGPTWTFTTQPDPNQPPYTPSSPSPANGATNVGRATFLTWTGGDPNGDTVYYDVYRDVGSTANTLICDDVTTASCPAVGPPAPLAYSTTYAWRVVARDPAGRVTNGPTWTFTTQANPAPSAPSNPSPANGATGVSRTADGSWSASADPDGEAITYDVYFGTTNPPPSTPLSGCAGLTTTTCNFPVMTYGATYWWKVRATDSAGKYSESTWSFTVMQNPPPSAPSSPSPANGATGVSRGADGAWGGGVDPDGETVTYNVYFGTTNPPPTTPLAGCGGLTVKACNFPTMAYGTTYWWKVVATDSVGKTSEATWSFTTVANQPPTALATPSPANGATGVSRFADASWTGGADPENEGVTYDVYLGTANPPPSPPVCDDVATASCDLPALAPSTLYYWKVVATDAFGATTQATWSFTTRSNQAPTAPGSPTPANGASNVGREQDLFWSASSDPDGEPVTYTVYFESGDTTPDEPVCAGTSLASCDPGQLGYGSTYYWQVVASDGSAATASAVWSFSTAAAPDAEDTYAADFEDGTDDWALTGLWHRAANGESAYYKQNPLGGNATLWFGLESTGTYNNGLVPATGTAASETFSLVGVASPVLSFVSWYETQDQAATWDTKKVSISTDGGTTWLPLTQVSGAADYRQWALRLVDLSSYGTAANVKVRFEFTADAQNNNFRGWYIDDVRVFSDADRDGLSAVDEARRGSDPTKPDTDGDTLLDIEDRRATVEDVLPYYPPGNPAGNVYFYTSAGFADVDLLPPADNAGVRDVDFSLKLQGVGANGAAVDPTTSRLFLTKRDSDGHWVGRFPLPSTFQGGRATQEDIRINIKDVNGNEAAYAGSASTQMSFALNWVTTTHPDYSRLKYVDISGSLSQSSYEAEAYNVVLPPLPIPQTARIAGIVLPEGWREAVGDEPPALPQGLAPPGAALPSGPDELPAEAQDVLHPIGTQQVSRAQILSFGSFWNRVWEGAKVGWDDYVRPAAEGFLWGSSENGAAVAGDFIAGFVVYGDVRDIVLGVVNQDEIQLSLGAIGLATTLTGPGDAVYSALKPLIKLVPRPLAKILVRELDYVVHHPSQVTEFGKRLADVATHVGTDVNKADRLLRFSNAFADADHALVALKTADDVRAVDGAVLKYGDEVMQKFNKACTAPCIKGPEDFAKAAKAEKLMGGSLVDDVGEISDIKGARSTLDRLDGTLASGQTTGAKGYAQELKIGAKLKRLFKAGTPNGGDVVEFNKQWSVTVNGVATRLDGDVVQQLPNGKFVVNEIKNRNKVYATTSFKNQIDKMATARGIAANNIEEARVIVANGNVVADTAKTYARGKGISIYTEDLVLIN